MEQQEQANAVQLPMTPEATSAALSVRYMLDAEFRAAFDKDPKAAIAKLGGEELPSDLEIVVHRNEDKRWHLTLPAMEADGALDDEDIENVAGGAGPAGPSQASIDAAICASAATGYDIAPGFAEMGLIFAAVTAPAMHVLTATGNEPPRSPYSGPRSGSGG